MEGGEGGGGATEPAPPSAQPRVHAPTENKAIFARSKRDTNGVTAECSFARRICGRGRIWSDGKAGEVPAGELRWRGLSDQLNSLIMQGVIGRRCTSAIYARAPRRAFESAGGYRSGMFGVL